MVCQVTIEYSKWIKDLNIRPDAIKLLEENVDRTLLDINHILFDPPPRIMTMKTKINQWNLIKSKSIFTAKKTIKKKQKNKQNQKDKKNGRKYLPTM